MLFQTRCRSCGISMFDGLWRKKYLGRALDPVGAFSDRATCHRRTRGLKSASDDQISEGRCHPHKSDAATSVLFIGSIVMSESSEAAPSRGPTYAPVPETNGRTLAHMTWTTMGLQGSDWGTSRQERADADV